MNIIVKILLTGASGFVGRHLSQALRDAGHRLCAVVRPTTDTASLRAIGIHCFRDTGSTKDLIRFFKEQEFTGVIHLASYFTPEHKLDQITDMLTANVVFATRVLDAAVGNTKWFINTGTFWQHYHDHDYSPANLYAASKQAFETMAQYYLETSDILFVTLKLSDTYGPDDSRAKILNKWREAARTAETMEMSQGEQLIDTVFIDDVVRAYLALITALNGPGSRQFRGRTFAVSSGAPIPLRRLAEIFEKVSGARLNIQWGAKPYRKREVMTTWTKGVPVPGWKPTVSLEEGISKMLGQ